MVTDLVNLARDMFCDAIIGGSSYTKFDNSNAALGVGNSNTAYSAAHTDLQGGSKAYKGQDATYPQRAANVVTWRSTFDLAEANFTWEEWGVFNATSSGDMLLRKVANQGTKTSAEAWQLEVDVTLTLG